MHSTVLSKSASLLPSRAIGNVLLPTYEVVITSLLHSNDLLFVERIKCNITLVDNHGSDSVMLILKYLTLCDYLQAVLIMV